MSAGCGCRWCGQSVSLLLLLLVVERVAGIWQFLGGRAGKEGKFPFFSVGGVTDCKSRFDVNQLIR